MKESLIADDLFRRAFIVALLIGVLCRGLVLRVTDKQYPSRPQDYLEQIIISGLSASLGAIAFPALIDKEFSALTFFAVAIQQFQGLSQEERITIENIDNVLKQTKTVFLNGPAGAFEYDNFSYGTKEVLKSLKNSSAKVIIGGGDSASAAIKFGYKNSFYHISTGGGASLEFLSGRDMPGFENIGE